ncbi:hypothetical protein FN846DRAFT_935266 [Sphaerosporella brunnea]|uniref:Uncharacterized protein n=1 Tax=Sphaerosporella brunnea TaxID=1250544 RepID=A0A5J5F5K5_9PEZI|nr:hypothetical protein FN846DRAFT_935266 [Sphaerosporella brunnea]
MPSTKLRSWATTNGRGIYTLRNSRFSNLSVLSSIIAPGTPRLEISRTREKCDLEGNPVETPPLVWDRFFGDFWRAASPARQLARASRGSEVARPISLIYERPASPTIRNQPPIPVYQARPPPAPPAIEWIPTVIDPESERGHLPESPPPTPVESARGSQKIIATPKKSLDEVGFITTQDIIKNNRNRIHRDERGFFQLPSPPASPAPPANRASGPSRGTSGPPETFSEMDVILQTDEEHRKSSNSIQGPVKRLFRSRTRKATSKENRRPSLGSSPGEHQGRNRVGSLGTVEERSSYETDQDEMQSRESINTVSSTGDDPQHRKPISKKGRKWRSGGHALMERAKKLSWGKGLGSLSKRHK